jgi:two-component system, NarL family, nitrate/nitrite response regulator NarL
VSPRTTVLVADDHPLFRDGIARAVGQRTDLELIAAVADGNEALEGIRRHTPDVAVLDVRMPGMDGVDVLKAVQAEALSTRVLLLSAYTDSAIVYAAVTAGAGGYLSKDADRQAICDAISAVARGEPALDPVVHAGLFEEVRRHRAPPEAPLLTDREQQVLELIAAGLTAPTIAGRLEISATTVKTHLAHLYEKLGVSDRAAAVAEGMRRGLLE